MAENKVHWPCCDCAESTAVNGLRNRLCGRRMIWLLSLPPSPLPSVSSTGDTQEGSERETTCWGGGGEGEGEVAKSARKFGPLL
jgi:hypothetical protein